MWHNCSGPHSRGAGCNSETLKATPPPLFKMAEGSHAPLATEDETQQVESETSNLNWVQNLVYRKSWFSDCLLYREVTLHYCPPPPHLLHSGLGGQIISQTGYLRQPIKIIYFEAAGSSLSAISLNRSLLAAANTILACVCLWAKFVMNQLIHFNKTVRKYSLEVHIEIINFLESTQLKMVTYNLSILAKKNVYNPNSNEVGMLCKT